MMPDDDAPLSARLARMPLPRDADLGAEAAARVPGADPDLRALLTGVASLAALADASLEDLTPLLGRRDAGRLFSFLRRPLFAAEPSPAARRR